LRGVLDLEALLQALARGRLVAAGRLEAIDGVDATLRGALVVLEEQPLDGALGVGAGARRHGRVRLAQLADQRHRVRGRELVKREDRGGAREEVVADHVLEAEGCEVLRELGWLRHQGEGQWGDGGDGPFGEGAGVQRRANVVQLCWAAVSWVGDGDGRFLLSYQRRQWCRELRFHLPSCKCSFECRCPTEHT
jgi:hypothetical protein